VKRFTALLVLALASGVCGCGGRGGKTEQQAGTTPSSDDANAPAVAPAAAPATPAAAAPAAGGTSGSSGAPAGASTGGVAPGQAGGPTGTAPATGASPAGGVAGAPAPPTRRDVTLFFERADDDALGPETRPILLSESIIDQAKQIVSELASGPQDKGLLPTVPQETKVLGLYLDRSGTAYVDLSGEFVDKHPGGSSDELATVFSIVDSLTFNLPAIRRVRFLVNGEERDTLASHLDLRRAYIKDMSIVKMDTP
jgi:germination protein M